MPIYDLRLVCEAPLHPLYLPPLHAFPFAKKPSDNANCQGSNYCQLRNIVKPGKQKSIGNEFAENVILIFQVEERKG